MLVLENTVHCADEKSQNRVLRAHLRRAFASSRQLGTSTGQPWETSESRASTVPSETGKRKGGSAPLSAFSLKTGGFINWWKFKGRLICLRVTRSQSRDSGAGAPWTHCKDGEGAKNSSRVRRVSQSMSEHRAANPASPPLWAVSLVLGPTCWWDLWSQVHSSLLPSVNYFSPKSLLIFCFHISKRGGFCGLVFLIGVFFFLPCFLNDCFYFLWCVNGIHIGENILLWQ